MAALLYWPSKVQFAILQLGGAATRSPKRVEFLKEAMWNK